jgi:hypothetical protein
MLMLCHMKVAAFTTLLFLTIQGKVFASPTFCSLNNLLDKKIPYSSKGIDRAHIFKIGKISLAGLAVGTSDASAVEKMAQGFGGRNSCVWYLNKGNKKAQELFSHYPLPYPKENADLSRFEDFMEEMISSGKFETCIKEDHFLTLGCNEMKHRGPTAMGMILAFAGCSALEASNIVNGLWGLNGVDESIRLEVINQGVEYRKRYPQLAQDFQGLLEN